MPTSPRGLEATASRLPSRYRPPRRPPQRPQRRLFVVASVVTASVLLLGSLFLAAPLPTPPPQPAADDALSQSRLPQIAVAGPLLLVANDSGLSASTEEGAPWSPLPSPGDNALTALAVSPQDPNLRYASGLRLGIVRSEDGGSTWQAVLPGAPAVPQDGTLPLAGHLITALAIDPADTQRVFAWSARRGLLTSADGGSSWQFASSANAATPIVSLLFLPGEPPTLWAGGGLGLYRSDDSGLTWATVPRAAAIGSVAAVTASGEGALIAAGEQGELWRSDDSGVSWNKLGTIESQARLTSLSRDPATPARFWAASGDGRLWRSDDGGASWSVLAP